MPPKFMIHHQDEYFGFIFKSEDDEIILLSRLFRTRPLCKEGITELQRLIDSADAFEKIQGKDGQHSFVVRNKKRVALGHSPVFFASATRDAAIRKLQQQAGTAEIEEAAGSKMGVAK